MTDKTKKICYVDENNLDVFKKYKNIYPVSDSRVVNVSLEILGNLLTSQFDVCLIDGCPCVFLDGINTLFKGRRKDEFP